MFKNRRAGEAAHSMNTRSRASNPGALVRRVFEVEDPFMRTSAMFLALGCLMALYTGAMLVLSDEPGRMRVLGGTALVVLLWIWSRVHIDDQDFGWLMPFEVVAVLVIGLGVGDFLHIQAIFFVGLFFRPIRSGVGSAVARAALLNAAFIALVILGGTDSEAARAQVVVNLAAFPMVAVTMSMLGAGMRHSGRHQLELADARDAERSSHRKLAAAEQLAGTGSWAWDIAGNRAAFSAGYLSVVGREFDPTYEGWTTLIHPDDVDAATEGSRIALRSEGHPVDVEYRIVRPDGAVRNILSRAQAVHDEQGEVVGLRGTVHDITNLRALGTQLAHQQELSEMKSRFLSTVSHELRTPLTSLVGFTDAMLEEEFERSMQTEFLTVMREQGAELEALIEDLITFGRIEAEELTFAPIRTDIGAEVCKVVTAIGARGNSIVVTLDSDLFVWAEPLRVRQIIRNLLDNAFKYGETPIVIHAYERDGHVACEVRDSGAGIDSEHVDLIFEPYRRLVDDRTMGLPGVGLGLPLCRMLAERQSGSLEYVGSDGGATFRLTLPVPADTADVAREATDRTSVG